MLREGKGEQDEIRLKEHTEWTDSQYDKKRKKESKASGP